MQHFINILFVTLILNILLNYIFVCILTNRINVISTRPKLSAHNWFFTSGWRRKSSFPVILFIVLAIISTESFGTLCIKKWTWFSSAPISTKCISYLSEISLHTATKLFSTNSDKTLLRYFIGETIWYNNKLLLCRLWICSLILQTYCFFPHAHPEAEPRGIIWINLESSTPISVSSLLLVFLFCSTVSK